MKMHLIAVGKKMPAFVEEGVQTYQKRLPPDFQLNVIEIDPAQRNKNFDVTRALAQEEARIYKAIPPNSLVVALAIQGKNWDTPYLAQQLESWGLQYSQVCFLVGGPDGLSSGCIKRAHLLWSLSALTLPHPLVRVIVAEQLYRAHSLLNHHPYHRH